MSKQPPPAPTASAVGPCPTVIQIVGRPGTGSLPTRPPLPTYSMSASRTVVSEALHSISFVVMHNFWSVWLPGQPYAKLGVLIILDVLKFSAISKEDTFWDFMFTSLATNPFQNGIYAQKKKMLQLNSIHNNWAPFGLV